jgi:hypothetical protein
MGLHILDHVLVEFAHMVDDPLEKGPVYLYYQLFERLVMGKHVGEILDVLLELGVLLTMFTLVRIVEQLHQGLFIGQMLTHVSVQILEQAKDHIAAFPILTGLGEVVEIYDQFLVLLVEQLFAELDGSVKQGDRHGCILPLAGVAIHGPGE